MPFGIPNPEELSHIPDKKRQKNAKVAWWLARISLSGLAVFGIAAWAGTSGKTTERRAEIGAGFLLPTVYFGLRAWRFEDPDVPYERPESQKAELPKGVTALDVSPHIANTNVTIIRPPAKVVEMPNKPTGEPELPLTSEEGMPA